MSAGLLGGKTAGHGPDPSGRRRSPCTFDPGTAGGGGRAGHLAACGPRRGVSEDDLARMVLVTVGRAVKLCGTATSVSSR